MSETPTPITPPWNNSTATGEGSVVLGGGEATGQVQQGPMGLAELLYNPPAGTMAIVWAVALIVIVLAGLAAYRHGVDEVVLEEMGEIGIICFAIWGVTTLVVDHAGLPYWADVLVGTSVGFGVAKAVVWAVMTSTGGRVSDTTSS